MRVVIALGGNALLKRNQPLSAENLLANIQIAAQALAPVLEAHECLICHGNGPQVGLLALEDAQYQALPPYPLDLLVAETQGMIGYPLQQALQNQLPQRQITTVVTQVLVDDSDPAFQQPSKPIGPVYDEESAAAIQQQYGWTMAPDGKQLRRVVPSPQPQEIIESATIHSLLQQGSIVITAGGGGIPVVRQPSTQTLRGVEAVVDKDHTAACLAAQLNADALLILTDVDAVYSDWGGDNPRAIRSASPVALEAMSFAAGSMAPKIAAACQFVKQSGGVAMIGALAEVSAVLNGEQGTQISQQFEQLIYQ